MDTDGSEYVGQFNNSIDESQTAVNKLILDYYKKFGKKRDLEQFFSLSTATSDIRDPTSLFWRKMKSQTDSSDSGEKKSESSTELCRISIKCSIPEPSTSQEHYHTIKSDSESPPIIREEDAPDACKNSDNDSVKSEDNFSHKSLDGTLDTSINKPFSPTSSVTSQRKLEWDSLADVGYANESDRKNSASSLSTIERMALQQQYSNNDTKHTDIGLPTAQSTPLEVNDNLKNKKGLSKKTTKIYNKEVDSVKLNITQNAENIPQPINVNLTKHISFNVEKDGGVTIENVSKSVSVSPEKVSVETGVTPQSKTDKEIQTTLTKTEKTASSCDQKEPNVNKFPILINLNTLKKRTRKRKIRRIRRQSRRRILPDKKPLEKSTEQLSEAESFEYMPGHIYNQNQMMNEQNRQNNTPGNKSSLESSAGATTDSSKTTKYSFSNDLEKGIDILKAALEHRYEDSRLRRKLIKEVVQRLIKSKYKDDESSTEFLSGLSFDSKKIDLYHHTTSSASDVNNTADKAEPSKPKKSILRMDKFNANAIASTSQSVPNLPIFSKCDKPIESHTKKAIESNTDSDLSSKTRNLSDTQIDKTSSDVLYKKYLEALKREEAYKKHLKDKEIFLKQKLVSSDLVYNAVQKADVKSQNNLKDLMNDLIRNNYNDGSGDASKVEGGSSTNINIDKYNSARKQRSHSVFTLSSGNSDNNRKKATSVSKSPTDCSKSCYKKVVADTHYCCCPFQSHPRVGVTDSSVQVDLKSKNNISPDRNPAQTILRGNTQNEQKCEKCKGQKPLNRTHLDCASDEIKYVCLCTGDEVSEQVPGNILIYKCSRLTNNNLNLRDNIPPKSLNNRNDKLSSSSTSPGPKSSPFNSDDCGGKCLSIKDNSRSSKSSQTNLNLPIKLQSKSSGQSLDSSSSAEKISSYRSHSKRKDEKSASDPVEKKNRKFIHEATRWIQTEISINPKISDPSLTDINIINDANCVKLIGEQYKEISQSTSENNISKQAENHNRSLLRSGDSSSSGSYSIDGKNSAISCNIKNVKEASTNTIEKFDKEIQPSQPLARNNAPTPIVLQSPKNFTIPIQGTNMTLKVSLGSEIDNSNEKKTLPQDIQNNLLYVSKGTEAMKNNVVENFTSLHEECSKGVQSNNANIFNELYQLSNSTCCDNRNVIQDIKTDRSENIAKSKPCYINACLTNSCKYNTYPQNDRKPLLRSNTDTGKMEKTCHVTFNRSTETDNKVQPKSQLQSPILTEVLSTDNIDHKTPSCCSETSVNNNNTSDVEDQMKIKCCSSETDIESKASSSKDPLLDMIQDITRRYSKKDIEKSKRKKCYKDIITFLNYLLDTDEASDRDRNKKPCSSACEDISENKNNADSGIEKPVSKKTFVDKGVQLSDKKSKSKRTCTDSSDVPISTDMPSTSSDSATCKILNKIKRECDKYHQKRCQCYNKNTKCEASSSTSVNCNQCRRVHHCSCRGHKCRGHKNRTSVEKKKKCVAYNLIIQTSDSVVSEEVPCDGNRRQLQNIVVKVPSKRKVDNVPFKELASKIEKKLPNCSPRCPKSCRSKSLPNDSEMSSTDDILKNVEACTVREYLEKNRPDFVQKCSNRQHCLKVINETRPKDCDNPRLNMIVVHPPSCAPNACMETCNMYYKGVPINDCNLCANPYIKCVQNEVTRIANERSAKRQLLSLQLDRQQALSALSETDLKEFAKQLGDELRRKKVAPKFISEREMKKHSEKIYKSLPEVLRKKEEMKKENIKKTNLLMANIFKKNLQKKTLQGAVNISNYSAVIKI